MKVNVKIKRLNEHAVVPKYAHEGDVCFDLVSTKDVIIEPGQTVKIPTGWAMQQPPGYAIEIRPRSGISENTKLRISNSPGTIDQYTGEIGVLMDNIAQEHFENSLQYYLTDITGSDTRQETLYPNDTYIIRKGDRIAQALVTPVEQAHFNVVDELSDTCRGDRGFGSSGVK